MLCIAHYAYCSDLSCMRTLPPQSCIRIRGGGGGGGGTLILSYIHRLGSFFGVQNYEFHFFWGGGVRGGFSKMIFFFGGGGGGVV